MLMCGMLMVIKSTCLLISAPSYESLLTTVDCLSVPLSVTPLQIASFLFLDGIEPFFGHQFSMWHYKTLFLDF